MHIIAVSKNGRRGTGHLWVRVIYDFMQVVWAGTFHPSAPMHVLYRRKEGLSVCFRPIPRCSQHAVYSFETQKTVVLIPVSTLTSVLSDCGSTRRRGYAP